MASAEKNRESSAPSSPAVFDSLAPNELAGSADWHLKLFSKSVLKQRKLREIQSLLDSTSGRRCLDLGSDNGVISYYLRAEGGEWSSADLTQQAVDSIKSLVVERVSLLDGFRLPYADAFFDVVVVVDMLEHVEDDSLFVAELSRILRPGGQLIVNAPNLMRMSLLRGVRHLIGQTDEKHGHLRPGYGSKELANLFSDSFELKSSKTYSRFFSEFIDTAIVFAYGALNALGGKKNSSQESSEEEVSKGLLVTEEDLVRFQKSFKLYSMIYPVVSLFSKLDLLIFFLPGFMRITSYRRRVVESGGKE